TTGRGAGATSGGASWVNPARTRAAKSTRTAARRTVVGMTGPPPEWAGRSSATVRRRRPPGNAGNRAAGGKTRGLRVTAGPAVVPGKPAESLLLSAVAHAGELKMPPKGKLAQAQIDALTKWVEMGAPWPAGELRHAGPPPVDDRARNFWSFRPVVRPPVPAV